jgi:6-phosphogluconolactonase
MSLRPLTELQGVPVGSRQRAVALTFYLSLLMSAGCNGVSGYTFDGNSSMAGGTSAGGAPRPINTLGGAVSGLTAGAKFVIENGLGDTLMLTGGSENAFVFPKAVPAGETYNVTVVTQPDTPTQVCRVSQGSGVMSDTDITNVMIRCVSPGKYLFAAVPLDASAGTGSVAAFTIDPHTGELTAAPGSPYATTQSHPSDIALDPSGRYIYTSNAGSDNVSTDLIGAGGVLTLDVSVAATGAGPGTPDANSPGSIAVSPDGAHLYVGSAVSGGNGAIEAYVLNGGVLTPAIGTLAASTFPAGKTPLSIAVATATPYTKALLLAAEMQDSTIEDWVVGAEGTLTESPGSPFPFQNGPAYSSPFAVAIYPGNNFLYVTDSRANSVAAYVYNVLGNDLTLIATYSVGALVQQAPEGLTIDPTGSFLYVACSGAVTAFSINPTTGLLAIVGAFRTTGIASSSTPTSVRVDPSSQFAYVSNGDAGTISIFKINFANGALTPVGNPVTARISNGGPSSMVIE